MDRIAGCGRLRWNVACKSPSVVTSARFAYQSLRGFLRNLFCDLPCSISNVHFTSALVNGLPSCHLTPSRSLKVSAFLSALQDQLVASSGWIVSRLFCGLCGPENTRFEEIGIEGTLAEKGAAPRIDRLAGVS